MVVAWDNSLVYTYTELVYQKDYTHTRTHMHTHTTWSTYVLRPTMTSWLERWPQFVKGSKWEVEEKLK